MKAFIFAFDHALPTAMALSEEGTVICNHAGDSYQDAINWLLFHHQSSTLKEFEVVIMDEKLVKANTYGGEDLSKLDAAYPGIREAFKRNNEKRKMAIS